VEVVPQSLLARALGATGVEVNSFHHQGIRQLAPGLKVSAVSPDGLAEGLEQEGGPSWLLAVQWHPEEFHAEAEPPDLGLFQALVREAARSSTAARQDQWR
jgi:putative glutamine amidotransferase